MRSTFKSLNALLAKLGFGRTRSIKRYRRNYLVRRLRLEMMEDRRVLSAVTVNTTADLVDAPNLSSIAALIANTGADGKISLRESILAANADTTHASDTITFDSSLSGGQIKILANGQFNVTGSVTIDAGSLSDKITIDGEDPTGGFHNNGDGTRIFNVSTMGLNPSPSGETFRFLYWRDEQLPHWST